MSLKMSHPKTKFIGITGGIGSGKSYVCRLLEEAGIPIFYTDDEAKKLIRHYRPLQQQLTAIVGPELYDAEGRLVKSVMAAYLCRGEEYAERINHVVHPCVADAFRQWTATQTAPLAGMECALLFESGFNRLVDRTILVAAPLELRISRVMQRDHLNREQALHWIHLQMTQDEKRRLSDYVIENDEVQPLKPQIDDLQRRLSFFDTL